MGGKTTKKGVKKRSRAKKNSSASSKTKEKQTPQVEEKSIRAPPKWYLYAIIILNIFGLIADYLILNGHSAKQTLTNIELIITPLWLLLCAGVVMYLLVKKAQKRAYVLPVYYLVFFLIMYSLAKYIKYANVTITQEALYTFIYILLGVTTVFEIGASVFYLKEKK